MKRQLGEDFETGDHLLINYNIAPTQQAYVVTNEAPNMLDYFSWGLVPYWSKDGKNSGKLINARMEGIADKPSFRVPIRRRRCWVLADSFYEWRKEGNKKTPYRILLKSRDLMIMAGIWDIWHKDGQSLRSFSIITAPPNREVSALHNRMPVLLVGKEQQEKWLQEIGPDMVLDLLNTPPDGILDYYRISEKVNSVRNNSPELHLPAAEPPVLFE